MYTLGAIPIFGGLPYLINQCVTDPTGPLAPMYLAAFCGSTVAAISIMGGVFAVLPAYEVGILKSSQENHTFSIKIRMDKENYKVASLKKRII